MKLFLDSLENQIKSDKVIDTSLKKNPFLTFIFLRDPNDSTFYKKGQRNMKMMKCFKFDNPHHRSLKFVNIILLFFQTFELYKKYHVRHHCAQNLQKPNKW